MTYHIWLYGGRHGEYDLAYDAEDLGKVLEMIEDNYEGHYPDPYVEVAETLDK